MLAKPVVLPAWVVGSMALASGIIIAAGIFLAVVLWGSLVPQHVAFSEPERTELRNEIPGGTFVNSGTYRACVRGQFWFYYAGGRSTTFGDSCWR